MKRFAALLALLFSASVLTACGSSDPHEAAMEDAIDVMSELNKTLAKVKDADSVKDLSSKFESIGEQFQAVFEDIKKLEEPSEEQVKAIEEKYKPQMEEMQEAMEEEMKRIKALGPEVMAAVVQEMENLQPEGEMPDWMQ